MQWQVEVGHVGLNFEERKPQEEDKGEQTENERVHVTASAKAPYQDRPTRKASIGKKKHTKPSYSATILTEWSKMKIGGLWAQLEW